MLNGYVTYDELKLITGYDDSFLSKLLLFGLNQHEVDLEYTRLHSRFRKQLFDLAEVEEWLKVHIF